MAFIALANYVYQVDESALYIHNSINADDVYTPVKDVLLTDTFTGIKTFVNPDHILWYSDELVEQVTTYRRVDGS